MCVCFLLYVCVLSSNQPVPLSLCSQSFSSLFPLIFLFYCVRRLFRYVISILIFIFLLGFLYFTVSSSELFLAFSVQMFPCQRMHLFINLSPRAFIFKFCLVLMVLLYVQIHLGLPYRIFSVQMFCESGPIWNYNLFTPNFKHLYPTY